MKNLYEAIQPLREKYPHLCLSEAVVACLDHNERLEEYCKELREENNNCKAQYQHWDERYSEALIKMREMKEEIERLRIDCDMHMQHEDLIANSYTDTLEEHDYIKMKYDIFKNTVQAMLPDETVKVIYSEFTKRMNEWTSEQVYKQIEPLFKKKEE